MFAVIFNNSIYPNIQANIQKTIFDDCKWSSVGVNLLDVEIKFELQGKNNLSEFCCTLRIKLCRILGISAFMANHGVTTHLISL